jgi:CRP-like cAMP-binding protein
LELTLESALSTGGLVGHSAYLLLVLSMMMRVMWMLRVLVIVSSLVAIAYDFFWLKDPVGVFWETLLVLVNVVQLAITHFEERRSTFNSEEAAFIHANFPGLSKKNKRRLLDLGTWIDGEPGTELTSSGKPISHLVYLADGEVTITSNDRIVAVCEAGAFIGEMTVLTAAPANGSARVSAPSRYWAVPAADLRRLVETNEEIEQAIHGCFQRNLLAKLVMANNLIEKSGGLESLAAS